MTTMLGWARAAFCGCGCDCACVTAAKGAASATLRISPAISRMFPPIGRLRSYGMGVRRERPTQRCRICDTNPRNIPDKDRVFVSMATRLTQRQQAKKLLATRGIARLRELRAAGITAATVSRMERDGDIVRL